MGRNPSPTLAQTDPPATVVAGTLMSAPPAITIIIPCEGPHPLLASTLASLREQRWVTPEIILVNCGPVLPEAVLAGVAACVTAPDDSHASAMNAGLAAAHGEWILFLRPGDRLVGEMVLSETLNWMKKTEAGVVAGEVAFDDGQIARMRKRVNPVAGAFVPPSATFYRATLFAENGTFDPALGTATEHEFNLRLWKAHLRFKPLPLRITAAHGRRSDDRHSWAGCREAIAVRHRYFSFARCVGWDALTILRWLAARVGRVFGR